MTSLILPNLTSVSGEPASSKFTLMTDIAGSSEKLVSSSGLYSVMIQMITVKMFTQQQAQITCIA
jgi:hypothetical protein